MCRYKKMKWIAYSLPWIMACKINCYSSFWEIAKLMMSNKLRLSSITQCFLWNKFFEKFAKYAYIAYIYLRLWKPHIKPFVPIKKVTNWYHFIMRKKFSFFSEVVMIMWDTTFSILPTNINFNLVLDPCTWFPANK